MKMLQSVTIGDECKFEDATELFLVKDGQNILCGYLFDDGTYRDSGEVYSFTAYEIRGVQFDDISEADEILRAEFWDSLSPELKAQFESDGPMRREAFNNWTDSLCKDGEICDDTYDECSLED